MNFGTYFNYFRIHLISNFIILFDFSLIDYFGSFNQKTSSFSFNYLVNL